MPPRKPTNGDSPASKLSTKGKVGDPPNEEQSLTNVNLPQNLIVPAEHVVRPMMDQPMAEIKTIIGESAASIQIQEQTTISNEQVSNTRTFSLEMPARKKLHDVPLYTLILLLAAIVGGVLVLIF